MLYLLDANVLITAHNTYYPIDQVPEYWEWLAHKASEGVVKIPHEIFVEIDSGKKTGDLLIGWINDSEIKKNLILDEQVSPALVRKVVAEGYAENLTDVELDQIGRDPFLIAYGLAKPDRCIVTVEVSSPKKQRQNRKIPDVCMDLAVSCCGPFALNKALGFRTAWRS